MFENLISLKYWFIKVMTGFLVWFEPAREWSVLLIVLIIADSALATWVKIDSKVKISIKAILMKMIKDTTLFLLYILLIHYFQTAFLKEDITIFKIMVAIPLIALITGIVESIEKLTGLSVATKAKEVFSSVFNKLSEKATKKDEDK